jgi:alkylation response protein AidB-like acyl-CoA dehydrogenase
VEGPAEVIDLLYSETEQELRDSVRAMLADRCTPAGILARCEGDEPYDPKLWRTLAVEMGLAGLLIEVEHGGAGATLREAAVVVEELGRAVAPTPFLGSAVIATTVVATANDRQLLGELASGARNAAVAMPFSARPGACIGAGVSASGSVLSGTITSVADALPVDVLLVRAGDELYAVDANAAGVTRAPVVSLDLTRRLCDISLDSAPGRLIASGSVAATAVAAGLRAGTAMLASEQIGIADWCLFATVDYLKHRYQFGRPVGGYQALKHRLADLWVGLTQGRAVARYAAVCVTDGDPDAAVAISLAQAHCGPLAVTAAEECVQLHGGIGFTWEHPAHLYLKRAKADAIAFGTADAHRQKLAGLVDLPGPMGA